jgi:hypothetical protein
MSNQSVLRGLPAGCAWAVLLLASASGCAGSGIDTPCHDDPRLICGLRNPEDLAVTPDRQSLDTGEYGRVLAVAEVGHPDNLAWSEGRLRVASLSGSLFANVHCLLNEGETCGAAFTIYEVDPLTLRLTRVFAAEGAPMGAATVAVTRAGHLYLGTYTGDRLRVETIGAN